MRAAMDWRQCVGEERYLIASTLRVAIVEDANLMSLPRHTE